MNPPFPNLKTNSESQDPYTITRRRGRPHCGLCTIPGGSDEAEMTWPSASMGMSHQGFLPSFLAYLCLVVLRYTQQLLMSDRGNNSQWPKFTSFLAYVGIEESLTFRSTQSFHRCLAHCWGGWFKLAALPGRKVCPTLDLSYCLHKLARHEFWIQFSGLSEKKNAYTVHRKVVRKKY